MSLKWNSKTFVKLSTTTTTNVQEFYYKYRFWLRLLVTSAANYGGKRSLNFYFHYKMENHYYRGMNV